MKPIFPIDHIKDKGLEDDIEIPVENLTKMEDILRTSEIVKDILNRSLFYSKLRVAGELIGIDVSYLPMFSSKTMSYAVVLINNKDYGAKYDECWIVMKGCAPEYPPDKKRISKLVKRLKTIENSPGVKTYPVDLLE